jgi:hypothetical protein
MINDNIITFAVMADYRITALVIMYFLYLVSKSKDMNKVIRVLASLFLVIEIFSTAIMVYTQFLG